MTRGTLAPDRVRLSGSEMSASARSFLDAPLRHYIDGGWTDSASGETFVVINPATGAVIARTAAAGQVEVDAAVGAARRAFDDRRWRGLPPGDRERRMLHLADLVERAADELAELEVLDNGMPRAFARGTAIRAAEMLRYYAGFITKIDGSVNPVPAEFLSYSRRQPIGVCVGITPWNGPLYVAVSKVAPAIACGNTLVLKPAENTPVTATRFAALCQEAGIPDGVINVVHGDGRVGAALVEHPQVDKISFTGSTEVGKRIHATASERLKRLTLELGGKSPNIVFADADLEKAAPGSALAVYRNTGQRCMAGTRLLVERSIHDEFVERLSHATAQLALGDGFDPEADLGPLISAEQFARVNSYIDIGVEEGAELAYGGARWEGPGFFAEPTIFTGVANDMRIAREEIFGPVVSVLPFDDEREAVAIANDTRYGLGAGLWTRDVGRAHRVAEQIDAGMVWVNTYGELPMSTPYGGFKESGLGRELGAASIDDFTEIKSVILRLD